eukprot:scaffold351660_cov38-Prasinocladus_malaysianus.AAC.1
MMIGVLQMYLRCSALDKRTLFLLFYLGLIIALALEYHASRQGPLAVHGVVQAFLRGNGFQPRANGSQPADPGSAKGAKASCLQKREQMAQ